MSCLYIKRIDTYPIYQVDTYLYINVLIQVRIFTAVQIRKRYIHDTEPYTDLYRYVPAYMLIHVCKYFAVYYSNIIDYYYCDV